MEMCILYPIKYGMLTVRQTVLFFGSYGRIKNGECTLYLSATASDSESIVYRVDDPEALADAFGIVRVSEHTHDIHAVLSPDDTGTGRYAKIQIEFRCGCTLSSHNSRSMKKYLRDRFGWEIVLSSINSERLSKRTVTVERSNLAKTQLPL